MRLRHIQSWPSIKTPGCGVVSGCTNSSYLPPQFYICDTPHISEDSSRKSPVCCVYGDSPSITDNAVTWGLIKKITCKLCVWRHPQCNRWCSDMTRGMGVVSSDQGHNWLGQHTLCKENVRNFKPQMPKVLQGPDFFVSSLIVGKISWQTLLKGHWSICWNIFSQLNTHLPYSIFILRLFC